MHKQQIVCYKIKIKSQKQLAQFKRRQENPILSTPRLLLGKLFDQIQQVWTQQFHNQKISSLRELHSNNLAFQITIQIINASMQLKNQYGNFIINENMLFITKSKKTFIWINPDIFANSPKIYLPPGDQGQASMVKGLINYLRLWLHTNFNSLSNVKTLDELLQILQYLKKQKPSPLHKDSSLVGFSFGSSSKDSGQKNRLYQSTKGLTIKRQKVQNYSKNSQSSVKNQKCFTNTNRCFTNQPIHQKYKSNQLQLHKTSKASNNEQNSQGQKNSFTNSFSKQSSRSFMNLKRYGKSDQQKFPNKTTSSTLDILRKIKQQDQNPDHYPANKILIQEPQNQNSQTNSIIKSSLGGINQQLDNLFMSNIQSSQNQQEAKKREKQFQQLLQI